MLKIKNKWLKADFVLELEPEPTKISPEPEQVITDRLRNSAGA